MIFHVLNRGVGRTRLFTKPGDYEAFEQIIDKTLESCPMRICAYCVMPNHWHLVVRPGGDGDLGRFMQRLTVTHARRWREHRHSVGLGHLYQGTYKSFPVQDDGHFLTVCRYVERNAARAGLVEPGQAQAWKWCSLWQRMQKMLPGDPMQWPVLAAWPVDAPRNWLSRVNQAASAAELDALRTSLRRGRPLGSEAWVGATAKRLGLTSTLRPRGRPKKAESE